MKAPRCSFCKKTNEESPLTKNKASKTGFASYCYACVATNLGEYRKQLTREWRQKNPGYSAKYDRLRKQIDPEYKIRKNLRHRINKVFKNKKTGSAIRDLGCSVAELMQHLSKQFRGEMSWDNYGKVWHIDHIKPLSKFNLQDKEQFLIACNYTNLQPLFAEENLKKGNR